MSLLEAIVLGLVQGLTEFLPVSSSGHLLIGKELFGINDGGTTFEVVVHAGTVLSTIVVFRKDILRLIKGFFAFRYSEEMGFVINIFVSMLPLALVYILFKDQIDALYEPPYNIAIVGFALLMTAALLTFTHFRKSNDRPINMGNAFVIGLAQSVALLPGLSRSGSTIATGLLLGNRREDVARFSFLMVLIPILGETFLKMVGGEFTPAASGIPAVSLLAAFAAAFVAGVLACKAMVALVKRSKLIWFAAYCAVVGTAVLIYFYA